MGKAERALEEEVRRWLREADAADEREDREHGRGRRGDELPEWVKDKKQRLEKIREAKARLEAAAREEAERAAREREAKEEKRGKPLPGRKPPPPEEARPAPKAQSNFTDPESRILKTKDGYVQGYNGQAAVDAGSQVIVAQGVVAEQNDHDGLVPMLDAIKEATGEYPEEASADSAYLSEGNLAALEERGIEGYIATGRQKHGEPSATDDGRGPPQSARLRKMWARLRRGGWRSRYRLRKQTVEPVFGQMKAARGFRQFLTRGLQSVSAEWSLLCTAHNVLKLAAAR